MEINNNLENYIKCYDNFFPEQTLSNLLKICKESDKFTGAEIVNKHNQKQFNEKIRKTLCWVMNSYETKSLKEAHWANLLNHCFNTAIEMYAKEFHYSFCKIYEDIQILKYNLGGHYKMHIDDGPSTPRTLSFIFFVNDDYEGGELLFNFNNSKKKLVIKKKKNRMVVWPSNFLFPHSVQPTNKGTRYSIVAWAR
jgi:predicted 2-oxoglutarate/Fe(II)-dependent dioxygenase YbiX